MRNILEDAVAAIKNRIAKGDENVRDLLRAPYCTLDIQIYTSDYVVVVATM